MIECDICGGDCGPNPYGTLTKEFCSRQCFNMHRLLEGFPAVSKEWFDLNCPDMPDKPKKSQNTDNSDQLLGNPE